MRRRDPPTTSDASSPSQRRPNKEYDSKLVDEDALDIKRALNQRLHRSEVNRLDDRRGHETGEAIRK